MDENKVLAKVFEKPLSAFYKVDTFPIKNVRENFEYVENKRTDKFTDTTLTVLNTDTLAIFKVKVPCHVNITQREIDEDEAIFYAQFPIEETVVRPYSIEYGRAKVTIVAPSVKIIRK